MESVEDRDLELFKQFKLAKELTGFDREKKFPECFSVSCRMGVIRNPN